MDFSLIQVDIEIGNRRDKMSQPQKYTFWEKSKS